MAMLAEPRRKQKVINLRAKNNAWSNDTNKFGQRMLEKMGWSSGKGLGAKESGIVEHVVARYKNDEKGLGFEDRNDQWTKHEDDFNALLSNLSNASRDDEKLHSGVSLEDKSKKSKARVHYHKFTRGKDLTRYSEKDLANIFGKKSFKSKEKLEEKSGSDTVMESDLKFNERGSMEDYFKNKLAAFKSRSNFDVKIDSQTSDTDYVFKSFSAQSDENESNDEDPKISFSFYSNSTPEVVTENAISNAEQNAPVDNEDDLPQVKKKKKKSKCKDSTLLIEEQEFKPTGEENFELAGQTHDCEHDVRISRKKSKRKTELEDQKCDEEIKNKKKKTKSNEIIVPEEVQENEIIPKKKKNKKKNKS